MKKIDFIINIVTAMLFIAIAVGCFGAFLWGWRFHLILLGVMSSYAGYVMITGTLDDMENNSKK
jgi:fatty acid desaturase